MEKFLRWKILQKNYKAVKRNAFQESNLLGELPKVYETKDKLHFMPTALQVSQTESKTAYKLA